jgi:hypothetical protein
MKIYQDSWDFRFWTNMVLNNALILRKVINCKSALQTIKNEDEDNTSKVIAIKRELYDTTRHQEMTGLTLSHSYFHYPISFLFFFFLRGWYDDKVMSIDPITLLSSSNDDSNNATINDGTAVVVGSTVNAIDDVRRREFIMNGVSDYEESKSNGNDDGDDNTLIVIRLAVLLDDYDSDSDLQILQGQGLADYYLGYNRADGINADTIEDQNRVTIIRKGYGSLPFDYSESTKVASLSVGKSYIIQDIFDKKRDEEQSNPSLIIPIIDIHIRFISLSMNGRDASIEIVSSSVVEKQANCKDEKVGKFRWKKKKKKRKCRWIAKKDKCNVKHKKKRIWKLCPKSCNRCDDL